MKIIHCLFTMEAGGAQILAVGLLNEMSKHHDMELIILNKWNNDLVKQLNPTIKIHYFNRKEGDRSIIPLIKLNILIYKLNADIIHFHEPNMVKLIKLNRAAKLVYTIHDVGISTTLLKKYDLVVAISDAVYVDASTSCRVSIKKIYNGTTITSFKQRTDYAPIGNFPIKLVQVSRLMHEKKGQDILLKSLKIMVEDYHQTNWSLSLIGSGNSKEYLIEMIKNLGLTDRVELLGEKNREWLFQNLGRYHVLIQPSRYEGFGLTIIEGIAAGLPVLASDIDGPKEIINKTAAGFLFKTNDSIDCAKELLKLFNIWTNGTLKTPMIQSQKIINENYSIKVSAKNYLQAYESIRI